MRKASSKSHLPALCLGLLIASAPAIAAYSEDPDCKPVSDGARAGLNRTTNRIDNVVKTTGDATSRAKSCVDEVVGQYNRVVPDFGGGVSSTISKFASDLLAKEGCQLLSDATSRATSALPSVLQPVVSSAVNGGDVANAAGQSLTNAATSAANNAANQATQSIWQKLSNLF